MGSYVLVAVVGGAVALLPLALIAALVAGSRKRRYAAVAEGAGRQPIARPARRGDGRADAAVCDLRSRVGCMASLPEKRKPQWVNTLEVTLVTLIGLYSLMTLVALALMHAS